jgi:serine/threonine-protein kinase RsbW
MSAAADSGYWLRLPFSPESAGAARRMLDVWLQDQPSDVVVRDDWTDDARLILSELVGNSVRHAAPLPGDTVEVGWGLADKGLDIAVRDGGSTVVPEVQQAEPLATAGRGLAIVEALCQRWWVDRSDQRTTTHALLV